MEMEREPFTHPFVGVKYYLSKSDGGFVRADFSVVMGYSMMLVGHKIC